MNYLELSVSDDIAMDVANSLREWLIQVTATFMPADWPDAVPEPVADCIHTFIYIKSGIWKGSYNG